MDSAEVLHLDSAALLPLQRFTVRAGDQLGRPLHSDGRPEFFVCDSGSDMVFEWMRHAKPSSTLVLGSIVVHRRVASRKDYGQNGESGCRCPLPRQHRVLALRRCVFLAGWHSERSVGILRVSAMRGIMFVIGPEARQRTKFENRESVSDNE